MFKHTVWVRKNGKQIFHDVFTKDRQFSWNAIWDEVHRIYGKDAMTEAVSLPVETFNEGGY